MTSARVLYGDDAKVNPSAGKEFSTNLLTQIFLPKQLLAIMQGWPDKTAQLPGRRVCTFFQGRVRAREFYFLKGKNIRFLSSPHPTTSPLQRHEAMEPSLLP